MIQKKQITKNLIISLSAQVISLVTSFVLGFIVPKFIDEYQYAYWQTFLLYISYVTLLHFGLLDGIVLRYGQYDYDELDKPLMRSQFKLLLIVLSIIAFLICLFSFFFIEDTNYYIIVLVACGIVTKNVFTYASYTFQITNRINIYALIVIAQRAVYAVFIIALLLFKVNDFYWYCIADLVGDICGILLGVFFSRGLYIGKSVSMKECFLEAKKNISAGIFLLIATFQLVL